LKNSIKISSILLLEFIRIGKIQAQIVFAVLDFGENNTPYSLKEPPLYSNIPSDLNLDPYGFQYSMYSE
jgi:hypothetical protein